MLAMATIFDIYLSTYFDRELKYLHIHSKQTDMPLYVLTWWPLHSTLSHIKYWVATCILSVTTSEYAAYLCTDIYYTGYTRTKTTHKFPLMSPCYKIIFIHELRPVSYLHHDRLPALWAEVVLHCLLIYAKWHDMHPPGVYRWLVHMDHGMGPCQLCL